MKFHVMAQSYFCLFPANCTTDSGNFGYAYNSNAHAVFLFALVSFDLTVSKTLYWCITQNVRWIHLKTDVILKKIYIYIVSKQANCMSTVLEKKDNLHITKCCGTVWNVQKIMNYLRIWYTMVSFTLVHTKHKSKCWKRDILMLHKIY